MHGDGSGSRVQGEGPGDKSAGGPADSTQLH